MSAELVKRESDGNGPSTDTPDAQDVKSKYALPVGMTISDEGFTWFSEFSKGSALFNGKGTLREAVQTDFTKIFTELGGPLQFLHLMLVNKMSPDVVTEKISKLQLSSAAIADRVAMFSRKLEADFKRDETWDRATSIYSNYTGDNAAVFQVHLADFSFCIDSSSKGPTYMRVALQLLDEYLLNGFITKLEPLRVWVPNNHNAGQPFQLCFVKGAARAHTLQALMLVFYLFNIDIATHLPKLYSSLHTIYACVPVLNPTYETVVLKNAQLAQRGAIKKPMDVFAWVGVIKKLDGLDSKDLMAKWNAEYATKDFKLTGSKRTAIMNLLNAPSHGASVILNQVGRLGSDNASISEDGLADKRLFPGHTWKQFQLPVWTGLLKVTTASFNLMCDMLVNQFDSRPVGIRQRMSKSVLEEFSQLAAMTTSIVSILETEYAIPSEVIQKNLVDKVCSDDAGCIAELQSHLHEKQANFSVLDVQFLADLVRDHRQHSDAHVLATSGQTPDTIRVVANELEQREWDLVLSKLNHDKNLIDIHQRKCQDLAAAHFHAARDHARRRHELGRSAAEVWMATNCSIYVTSTVMEAHTNITESLQKFARHLSVSPEKVLVVPWTNFAAPMLFSATEQKVISEITGLCVSCNVASIGLVFTPTYAARSGTVFQLENNILEKLSKQNLNTDKSFVLCFSHRVDQREKHRSLISPGRIATSSLGTDEHLSIFSNTPLFKRPVVDDAVPVRGRDMIVDTNLDEDAPPSSTDADTSVKPPEKVFQIGNDAAAKVLQSILTDVQLNARGGILLVDTSNRTNDLARAFVDIFPKLGTPAQLVIFTNNDRADWCRQNFLDHVKDKFLSGDLQITGRTPLPEQAPATSEVALPELTICSTRGNGSACKLVVPTGVHKDWHDNERFGADFAQWVKDAQDTGLVATTADVVGSAPDRQPDESSTPPPKRRRTTDPTPAKVTSAPELPVPPFLFRLLQPWT